MSTCGSTLPGLRTSKLHRDPTIAQNLLGVHRFKQLSINNFLLNLTKGPPPPITCQSWEHSPPACRVTTSHALRRPSSSVIQPSWNYSRAGFTYLAAPSWSCGGRGSSLFQWESKTHSSKPRQWKPILMASYVSQKPSALG